MYSLQAGKINFGEVSDFSEIAFSSLNAKGNWGTLYARSLLSFQTKAAIRLY